MRGEGRWPGEAVQSFRGQGWPERTRRTLVSRGGARVRENGSQETERGKRALGRADCGRVTGRHAGGDPHLPAGGEGKSASGWGCGAVTLTTSGQAGCWSRVPGPRRSPPGGHLLGDMASGPWPGARPSTFHRPGTGGERAESGVHCGQGVCQTRRQKAVRRRTGRVWWGAGSGTGGTPGGSRRAGREAQAGGAGRARRAAPGRGEARAPQRAAEGTSPGVSLTSREVEAGGGGVHGEAHRTPLPVC